MSQALLCLALWIVGLALCLAVGPRSRLHWCCAAAFAVGTAMMVIVSLAMLALGIPYTPRVLGIAAGLIVIGGLVLARGVRVRELRIVGAWAVALLVVGYVFGSRNYSVLSYDSHYMVMLGQGILEDHGLVPGMLERLSEYGVFQILVQSWAGAYTHKSYLFGVAPIFAISTATLFAISLWHGLELLGAKQRGRWYLVALVTFVAFSIYMVFRHAFYIHTNLGTATYILLFVAGYWLAAMSRDASWLPLAAIGLIAVALHRIENPLICVVLLALTVPRTQLPRRPVLVALALYAVVVCGWYALLGFDSPVNSQFLTPTRALVFVAFNLAAVGYAAVSLASWRWLDRLNRTVPLLLFAGTVAGIAVAFAMDHDHMSVSYQWFKLNLMFSSFWESTWWFVGLLWVITLFVPRPPFAHVFSWGAPTYFAMILLLAWGRVPYREGIGDSAARMAVHLVPWAFFYLGIVFIPTLTGREERSA